MQKENNSEIKLENLELENPIGIFDSGIGGATVLKEIIKILPNEQYIYYSDSINNPYGDKTKEELIEICDKIVKKFIKENCKAIVIACNTASALVVEHFRNKYKNMIFIAIEPAYKMVYDYSFDKTTLVMATQATINSERFNLLYNKYNNNKTFLLPCKGLADIIESGTKKEVKQYLEKNLKEYVGIVENVVLGCTHYPLIENEIKQVLGDNIKFFNGAKRLAVHLKDELEKHGKLEKNVKKERKIIFIDSDIEKCKKKEERFFNIIL